MSDTLNDLNMLISRILKYYKEVFEVDVWDDICLYNENKICGKVLGEKFVRNKRFKTLEVYVSYLDMKRQDGTYSFRHLNSKIEEAYRLEKEGKLSCAIALMKMEYHKMSYRDINNILSTKDQLDETV